MTWPIAKLVKEKTAVASIANCLIALIDFIRINSGSWFGVVCFVVSKFLVVGFSLGSDLLGEASCRRDY